MPLQQWIHHWEEGAGARILKVFAAILGFIAVAGLYHLFADQSFSSEEAMESAQLARNISRGDGFTTHCIRPLAIYLLDQIVQAMPDITNPPVYPLLLAGLMKVLPVHFTATQYWYYEPERWISLFNQLLFFLAVVLLFRIARQLFDSRVAWSSAILFAGTSLFWKFSISGLSTLWVVVVFLAMVMCLVKIAHRTGKPPIGWSALAGVVVGVGGLSRYSFAWMIVPVILFLALGGRKPRAACCVAVGLCFLIVMGPWVARNIVLSGTPFGTASFAVLQETPPLEEDTLERSLNPRTALRRVEPFDLMDKFLVGAREMWSNDLPRLGGNWVTGFFLVGLLMLFQSPARGRIRLFFGGIDHFTVHCSSVGADAFDSGLSGNQFREPVGFGCARHIYIWCGFILHAGGPIKYHYRTFSWGDYRGFPRFDVGAAHYIAFDWNHPGVLFILFADAHTESWPPDAPGGISDERYSCGGGVVRWPRLFVAVSG